ncbi:OLC1v1016290C1 [Oldenlandia corymbosa var. corymbosa]|uniref:OLC1v1016290C1 n=1 Tax=Oldenlandia corymbosa var. corymbosa TaxID=529605 RepID=A0AAV1E5D1_OLDCO|nr:OLC1v1016290C1 [Oldenlandia corymbosa var. corymbosa]
MDRHRTLQEGESRSAGRLVEHVIVPNPTLNRDERHEVRTRLQDPRDSRLFIIEFGWEFFQRYWNRILIIGRCLNHDHLSTYIDDKQWKEVENDCEDAIDRIRVKCRLSNTVKKALCRNPTAVEWSLDNYGCPEEFPAKHLKDKRRGWFNLVCTNIMPTKSYQFVSIDRALLIFAIINNITVDVASIIRQQMDICAVDEKEKGWFFPGLLTRLMKLSGVIFGPHDESSLLPLPWSLQGPPPD